MAYELYEKQKQIDDNKGLGEFFIYINIYIDI